MLVKSGKAQAGLQPGAQGAGGASALYNTLLMAAGVLLAIAVVGGLLLALSAFGTGIRVSPCVGVINIQGPITTEDSAQGIFSEGGAGSGTIAEIIYEANKSQDVRALLLVVDSPGGSVVGSWEIYEAVRDFQKPKVAYFRELATSGGYYVSAPADYIISSPDAITASIGVRATLADLSGLFEKVGYNETLVKSGRFKDMGNPSRPLTDEERGIFESIINESFGEFKKIVLEGREGKLRGQEEIFDARMMTGRQAYAHGLVDGLGNRRMALEKAAELGGILGEPEECSLDPQQGGLRALLSGASETFWEGFFAAAQKQPQARISAG